MLANFIPATGRISFVGITIPGMGILDGVAWVRYRTLDGKPHQVHLMGNGCVNKSEPFVDVHGSGRQQLIRSSPNREGIELTYRINNYHHQPFLLFQLSLTNHSLQPIYLQDMCLFQADGPQGGRVEMPDPDGRLCFFKVGWHAWAYSGLRKMGDSDPSTWLDSITRASYSNPATPRTHRKGEHWSEGWGVLADDKAAVVAGFASTAHQFGQVYTSTRPGYEALSLFTQADGIQLDPGETCDSEWAYLQFITLPNPEPVADYVSAVSRQMRARVSSAPPPVMWTHWYRFYHRISEQLLIDNVDALRKARELVPYQVVELDDGYQTVWGDWTGTNSKFPHGLEHLAGEITTQGFMPGLWLAPLVVQAKSNVARAHPEWLLRDARGHPVDAGFFYFMFTHALDASHPAVQDHLYHLVETLVQRWGYGMLKLDFLNVAAMPGRRYNPKLTRAECLRLGLETIRQTAGDNVFLLASGCPFGPAIGLVDAMRIGPDTAPFWEPNLHWLGWARPFFKHNLSMPSLRNATRHNLNLSSLNQRWWWNDPDCLLVRDTHSHLTLTEVQSAVTLAGLSGGLLVTSDDMRQLNPERLRWIGLLTPNLGLRGLPLDWLEHEIPSLYQVKLTPRTWNVQGWQLVGLFNWQDREAECRLKFSELGFAPGAELHVFDFWSGRYQRLSGPEAVFSGVPAHGCKLLRVCPAGADPQLVGDTLHISQGAELVSWAMEQERLRVETRDLGRRAEGELWLGLPRAPLLATCNDAEITIEEKGDGIYALPLQFSGSASIVILIPAL